MSAIMRNVIDYNRGTGVLHNNSYDTNNVCCKNNKY